MVDCSSCDRAAVRDADAIRKFCADLVSSIGMVAYGEPVLEHFVSQKWPVTAEVSISCTRE
jgi:hypothetical protein